MFLLKRFKNSGGPPESPAPPAAVPAMDQQNRLDRLTACEREVFQLLLQGCTMKEAAVRLNIGYCTVNTHMTNIYRKLNVNTRAQLILRYQSVKKEMNP